MHAVCCLQPRGGTVLSQPLSVTPPLVPSPGCLDRGGCSAAAAQQLPGRHATPGRLDVNRRNCQAPTARTLCSGEGGGGECMHGTRQRHRVAT